MAPDFSGATFLGSSPNSGERRPYLEEEVGVIAVAVGHVTCPLSQGQLSQIARYRRDPILCRSQQRLLLELGAEPLTLYLSL